MNVNSRYVEREMDPTSVLEPRVGDAAGGRAGQDDDAGSYYSSDEDPLEERQLLREHGEPHSHFSHYGTPSSAMPNGIYPQLHSLAPPPLGLTHAPIPAAAAPPVAHTTQYGSVSSSLPSNSRRRRYKRYRIPFLILLVFDFGLVAFLSIITYDSQKGSGSPVPESTYFDLDLKHYYFDLVLIAVLRLFLNGLLYLVMAWVTRIVIGVTTVVSAIYVPLKTFYCWPVIENTDSDLLGILILLILFVSFVMPWIEAFFFEFKYLPAELSRLKSTSWKNWEFWLWPRALVQEERIVSPAPDGATQQPQRPGTFPPHPYPYAASTVSLDFRTPMGSVRTSPVHLTHGDRSCNMVDEDLPPISEEATPSPVRRESPVITRILSEEDQGYKLLGAQTLQQMKEFTDSYDNWKHHKTSNGIAFYTMMWQGKKIWRAESEMSVSATQLWTVLYPGENMPEWSPQCTKCEIIHKIDDETEIIYSATSAVGPVSSRDFVSLRQIDNSNGCYMSACVATVHGARPPQPGRVRGENGPCGYKVVPVSDSKSLYIWVINTDLKGWLPQAIIDQTLSGVIAGTYQKLNTYIEQKRAEGRL